MGVVRLLSLAAASVLLVKANGEDSNNTAVRVDCSSQMNEARSLAGLSGLKVETESSGQLPIYVAKTASRNAGGSAESPNTSYLADVCKSMKAEKMAESVDTIKPEGTFAFAVQEGAEADCQAAVDHWKEAFTNFDGLPPANTTEATVYTSAQNVSFISLFNPKDDPKVDCAYFTCPAKTVPTGRTADKELKALLCVTTPKALTDADAPFTKVSCLRLFVRLSQEEWDRITKAINSGSAAVPTFFAVAAAAVAALFL